jgi:hypothetical protein
MIKKKHEILAFHGGEDKSVGRRPENWGSMFLEKLVSIYMSIRRYTPEYKQ